MELEAIVNKHYNQLNENELSIISYVLQQKEMVQDMSITDLASACHTSRSSILRLVQKIGFNGFTDFKYSLRQSVESVMGHAHHDLIDLLEDDIHETIRLFERTNTDSIIRNIYEANRIYCFGTGWMQVAALNNLIRDFLMDGKSVFGIPSQKEFSMLLSEFEPTDLVIIVSQSGETAQLPEITQLLSLKDIPSLSITEFKRSQLATGTTYNLYYHATSFEDKRKNNTAKKTAVTLHLILDLIYREYVSLKQNL